MDMMRDLQRSKTPLFDGLGGGLKAETWLLDMGYCFSSHLYESNVKARYIVEGPWISMVGYGEREAPDQYNGSHLGNL